MPKLGICFLLEIILKHIICHMNWVLKKTPKHHRTTKQTKQQQNTPQLFLFSCRKHAKSWTEFQSTLWLSSIFSSLCLSFFRELHESFCVDCIVFESPPWAGLHGWTASPMLCCGSWKRCCCNEWLTGSETSTFTCAASLGTHRSPSAGVKATQEEKLLSNLTHWSLL